MSIVEPLLAAATGVLIYVAAQHGVIAISRSGKTVSLSFAVLAAVASVYVVLGIPTYLATDPGSYVQARFLQVSTALVLSPVLAWFVRSYSGMSPRWPVWSLTGLYVGMLIVYVAGGFGPPAGGDGFPTAVLPWGETVAVKLEAMAVGASVFLAAYLLLTVYAIWGIVHQFAMGQKKSAGLLAFGIGALWVDTLLSGVPDWAAMPWDEAGFFALAVIMGFQLSRRASKADEAEEELEISEGRLRTMVEEAPDAVLLYDAGAQRYVEANQNAQRLFGASRDQLLSSAPPDLWLTDRSDDTSRGAELLAYRQECLESGASRFEWITPDGEGGERVWMVGLARLPGKDPAQVRVSILDVTDQRAAEAKQEELEAKLHQSQRLEAVGQLTGGVAHDFNNLLTVILGNLELLQIAKKEPGLNPAQTALVGQAVEAAGRGADLTGRLLAFSRKRPLKPGPVDIADLLHGVSELLSRTLPADVSLEVSVAEDLWSIRADSGLVQDALLNLCLNARDAMPGGGRLMVEAENVVLVEAFTEGTSLEPGEHVVVRVLDTGTGMSPDVVEHMFEPFFTTKDVGKGSGLGLSMVWGFVEQSEGAIKVASVEGEGTTIQIFLPRHERSAIEIEGAGESVEVEGGHGERVLIVEDDDAVRRYLEVLLPTLGYSVLTAGNGADALELLPDGTEVDLVLTDIGLPGGMSGIELVRRLRGRDARLPVVFTSGYIGDQGEDLSSLAGTDILQKPFNRSDLARCVREALDGHESPR